MPKRYLKNRKIINREKVLSQFSTFQFQWKDFLLIPNLITLSRLVLLPVVLVLLRNDQNYWAFIWMLLGVLSDALDGFLANKLHQVSALGKLLDPLVDKICGISLIVFFALYRNFPIYVLGIAGLRDVLILAISVFLIHRHNMIISSNLLGKTAVTLLGVCICLYTFEEFLLVPGTEWFPFLTAVFFSLSGIFYMGRLIWYFRKANPSMESPKIFEKNPKIPLNIVDKLK